MSNDLIVVSNSGPLISLSKIQRFNLLETLFGKIIMASAVYDEIVTKGKGRAGQKEVAQGINRGWIKVAKPEDELAVRVQQNTLAFGEAESIVLAQELNADLFLVDEKKARTSAQLLRMRIMGTVGILILAKQSGESDDLKGVLDNLIRSGFRLDSELYLKILREHNSRRL